MNNIKTVKLAMDFNRRSNDDLNNKLYAIRMKYEISEDDWFIISTGFSVITAREVLGKIRGG